MTDLDTSLATCPGCGQEIRWEHPRLRVPTARGGVHVIWHRDCRYDQPHETQRPHYGSAHEFIRAATKANESIRETTRKWREALERERQKQENLAKMRRGRR